MFGYDIHNNIEANSFTLTPEFPNNLYQPFGLHQDITSCPYKDLKEVFNSDEIISSLK